MTRSARRKQLALSMCCGVAGAVLAGYAGDGLAEAGTPLRVDPVLLGLPPLKTEDAPAKKADAAKPAPEASSSEKSNAQPGSAEVQPVGAPNVEARPEPLPETQADAVGKAGTAPESSPASLKAPAQPVEPATGLKTPVAPPPAGDPAATIKAPEPATPAVAVPAVAAPSAIPAVAAVRKEEDAPKEKRPEIKPQVRNDPLPASSSNRDKVSSMQPMRVDPALLGSPADASASARTPAAGPAQKPSQVAERSVLAKPQPEVAPEMQGLLPSSGEQGDDGEDSQRLPDTSPALALRASSKLVPLSRGSSEPRPVFLSADRMNGEVEKEYVAEGAAELRKIGTVIDADRMTYWPLEDETEAVGSVRMQQDEDVITGPKVRLRLGDQVGHFDTPSYFLKRQPFTGNTGNAEDQLDNSVQRLVELTNRAALLNSTATSSGVQSAVPGTRSFDQQAKKKQVTEAHGEAQGLDFEGENHYTLTDSTYTTCPVGNADWYLRSDTLKLDYDREEGEGKNATIYFQDVPILYAPRLSFPLNNERRSGFLPPSFSTNSESGFEYGQPYYWNIAPNMDSTIEPRIMTRRGVQLGDEFRYLNTAYGGIYRGKLDVELLPDDKLRDGDTRYGISLVHKQVTDNGFSGQINYNRVSDDYYYTDLSSSISRTSQTQLLQQGLLAYGSGSWNGSINFQQYQTLQPDENNPVLEQYRMLPQLTVNARKPDFYQTDVSFLGQYTNFTIRKREQYGTIYPDGQRTVLYPQIALPYVQPGWYITPKVGVNYRNYSLSGQESGVPGNITVTSPIFSVDSGMTFERSSNWFGKDYTQTLEPRLYYLNIPYRNQDNIPLFDTALADFNFAQIFSENQFSSWDRLNNANQLTAAVTSRLVEPNTGNEIVRAMIGQRYYFERNKVSLTDTAAVSDTKWRRSDLLAAFSGQVLPRVFVDTALQVDPNERQVGRYSLGLRYQPAPGKVLNASYRYNRDATAPINQVDLSGQWPINGRWRGVGRMNYSFKDDGTVLSTGGQGGRVIESIAGVEYNGGCWALRGVIHRQAVTSVNASSTFFLQLELSDFAQIGSNPFSMLKRNIQGYSQVDGSDESSVFDE